MDDNDKNSPLFYAIDLKDLELVQFLVEKCGADINHREIQSRTPLYYACSVNSIEIARYLMDAGAEINAQTRILRTTLSKCCWNG